MPTPSDPVANRDGDAADTPENQAPTLPANNMFRPPSRLAVFPGERYPQPPAWRQLMVGISEVQRQIIRNASKQPVFQPRNTPSPPGRGNDGLRRCGVAIWRPVLLLLDAAHTYSVRQSNS
ncbi:hypothetical protein VTJ04DRAFT_2056 [Mycothermus thermophilus]|uniref:uncharacterized protein n=1 Tax=Humicola insolens TaxID=85995 RepID=UPI003742315D